MISKSRIITSASWLFYVLVASFIVLFLLQVDFGHLRAERVDLACLLVATLLGLIFCYWGAFVWLSILKGLGAGGLEDLPGLVHVYAKAWLGRYIPGKAAWILAKIHFASAHGISRKKLAVSSLLEGGLQVLVVLALSMLLLVWDSRLESVIGDARFYLVILLGVMVMLVMPPIFNRIMATACQLLGKGDIEAADRITPAVLVKGAFLYGIGALFSGLAFYFVAKAFHPPLGPESLLFVVGASNLAGALGMLAIFAPSGLGVRDGMQLLLLTLIMPTEAALLVTVAMRLWSVLVDLLFFIIATTHCVTAKRWKALRRSLSCL